MKKLLTVVCLSGLLSVPSVVFAEASWYGSLRSGILSDKGTTGVGMYSAPLAGASRDPAKFPKG